MKKLRRFLAMMMTVIMTAGTLGDAGFTVFAAEPEAEEAVSEDAVSEDAAVISDEETAENVEEEPEDAIAGEAEEEETEEEDPAGEEAADDGEVTKLIVNGTNMRAYGKYGHFLKPDGTQYSGSIAEAMKKPYMYYDNKGTLELHDITLEGLYDATCGIEFEGDHLTINIIGNNSIHLKKGVAGKNSYGIYADGDLTITSTKSESGDRVIGYLGIGADPSIDKWMSSIYTTGKLTAKSPEKTKDENFFYGLEIYADVNDLVRSVYGPTGEIRSAGGMEFDDVYLTVYAANHKDGSYGILSEKALNFKSGSFDINGSTGEYISDSKTCAVCALDDITIGTDAWVSAYGYMTGTDNVGQGLEARGGLLTVSGELKAEGNKKAVAVKNDNDTGIILDGTYVRIPDEGKVYKINSAEKTISEYDNKVAAKVEILKGQYYDIWIGGERLCTDRLAYDGYLTDGSIVFDPEFKILTLENVSYLYYSLVPSPSAKAKGYTSLISTEIPIVIRGDAKIKSSNGILYGGKNTIVELQGAFDFTSTESSAVYLEKSTLVINGGKQALNFVSEKSDAISGPNWSSSIEVYNGTVNAKGAYEGINVTGNIIIDGGEVNAEGSRCAIMAFETDHEIKLSKGVDIIEPEGGEVKFKKNSADRDYCTVVDKNGADAKKVKLSVKKYDLWLGKTQVTSANQGDILRDGKASFDPETSTLTLNNVTSIPGGYKPGASFPGEVLIYSGIPVNIKGSATLETDNTAILIQTPGVTDKSTIDGNFTINAGNIAIQTDSILTIQGSGYSKFSAESKNCTLFGYIIVINNTIVDVRSKDNAAIICTEALGLTRCDLTAEGDVMGVGVLSDTQGSISMTDDMKLVEPTDGKIVVETGNTVIKDSKGEYAKKVRFASDSFMASALNPVPAGLDTATKLVLVKGQKFTMPGSGWKVADDKTSKKFVSVSKKGVLKAKKKTGDTEVAKITNGERTIEIVIVQPKFNNKSIKLNYDSSLVPQDALGFVPGSAELPVAYFSNAPEVLDVQEDGRLVPRAAGTATVTAYVNGTAYKCKVKVKEETIAKDRPIYMNVGKSRTLKIKNVKIAQWSSGNTNIATVDDKGHAKAVAAGTCTIVGADKDFNEYFMDVCVEDIAIVNPEISAGKSANKYNVTMTVGQATKIQFKAVGQKVMFKSNKGEVAYVNEAGEICAQTAGVAKLTGKINGKTVTIKVTVNVAP